MYPFERFTERAKRVLALAQTEALGLNHRHIGTEHLLLGLFDLEEGVAARALADLGISVQDVRPGIEAAVPPGEPVGMATPVPTSRVKRVIEHAFEEARRMKNGSVGTEHLLLGLVVEGNGVAAHVLADRGARPDTVRAAVERALARAAMSRTEPHRVTTAKPGLGDVLQAAKQLALAEGRAQPAPEHLLLAIVAPGTPIGAAVAGGADVGAVRRLGDLVRAVLDLRAGGQVVDRETAERFREAMAAWRRDLGIE